MAKRKRMTATAFQEALVELDIATYDEAAEVFGAGRRSLVRYGTGERPLPKMLENLVEAYLTIKRGRQA